METRRTRSGDLASYRAPSRNSRMSISARVPPNHELAKAVSQPMLVIPQPVLRSHECLDESVRLAMVNQGAYVALGIKEEPFEFEYDEESYVDDDLSSRFDPDESVQETHQEGRRTTRSVQRKRLMGLVEDDANNNMKQPKKRAPRRKKTKTTEEVSPSVEFNPIVVSTYSMAPNANEDNAEPNNKEYAALQPVVTADESAMECSSNNNNEFKDDYEPTITSGYAGETVVHLVDMAMDNESILAEEESFEEPPIEITPEITPEKESSKKGSLRVKASSALKSSSEEEDEIEDDKEEEELEEDLEAEKEAEESGEEEEDEQESGAEEPENTRPKPWALTTEEREKLTCSVCSKKCSRYSILSAHKKTHFDSNIYNCTHCNKTFSSESSYKHHIAYSGLAPHKCDLCGKSYFTEQKAQSHRKQCTGKNTERIYQCEECDRSYVMLCSLRTHIRERHTDFKPVKNLCCEMCGKRFRHKKYLELHMYSHSSEKKFECDICHRKYKSSDILRHHVRMVHKNLPRVQCEICQKEVSRVSLKAHIARHREKAEEEEESARNLLKLSETKDTSAPYCQICENYFENEKLHTMHPCKGKNGYFSCSHCSAPAFKTATELVNHVCKGIDNSKSRNSAKIYTCIFCNREYNCHTPWLYHVRHHTNDKPYPCQECDKSFRLKQGLKVHMRNHTGEKPFKCDQCPAAFKQKPFLLDHMNTHTGNKPYQCKTCQARFSVRSALSTHKRIHRREEKRNAEAASP